MSSPGTTGSPSEPPNTPIQQPRSVPGDQEYEERESPQDPVFDAPIVQISIFEFLLPTCTIKTTVLTKFTPINSMMEIKITTVAEWDHNPNLPDHDIEIFELLRAYHSRFITCAFLFNIQHYQEWRMAAPNTSREGRNISHENIGHLAALDEVHPGRLLPANHEGIGTLEGPIQNLCDQLTSLLEGLRYSEYLYHSTLRQLHDRFGRPL